MRNTFKKFMPIAIFALALVFVFAKPSFAARNAESFTDFVISSDDAVDEVVKASYDPDARLLTISGSGKIEYDKWAEMAQKFDDTYYTKTSNGHARGWNWCSFPNPIFFDISFKADEGKKIKLCNTGDRGGLFYTFGGKIDFNNSVDVSEVTDMSYMFYYAGFDGDISDWDVSNVEDMTGMFMAARKFNSDISGWDVSNVKTMENMFFDAKAFNHSLSDWNVSNVENMNRMFYTAVYFDQDLSDWDVSNVRNMEAIFADAESLDFDLSKWDTSKVESFSYVFKGDFYGNLLRECPFKEINLLNRENGTKIADATDIVGIGSVPDFFGFAKLSEFTWEDMPYDYWISEDGAPFVKENTKGATKTFKEDTKYILTRQINSHLEIGDYEGKYTGRAITIDDISHNSKDILGNDIDGTWSLDLNGYNGIDSGTYTVLVTFTPNDTDKYRTVTKEVEITMPKSENEGEEVIGNGNTTGTTGSSTGNGTTIADSETPQAGTGLPFSDVKETDWFYAGVKESFDKGLLLGTSADKFSPYMDVTRGMMVTVIYRMNNEPIEKVLATYPDVVKDSYYEKAVSWGTTNKVVKGYGTEYKPEKHITRQEMIAMLYRYYNSKKKDTASADVKSLEAFTDRSEVLDYAVNPMAWAVSNKLIVGRTKDTLAPKGELTRAELAVILQRFAKMMK